MTLNYPTQDFSPLMTGTVIGGLGILHVFLAQMAVGGGMLLCYFEWLRRTGRSRNAGRFINGAFQALVLVSFVLAAVTGVAIWFISLQVTPLTIGALVEEFQWIWATEWTFFCTQLVAGYTFLRYKDRLSGRGRMLLLVFYAVAAWFSLYWIDGILSFAWAPGRSADAHNVWSGFLNPSFWPLLIYRTVTSMAIAALAACLVINIAGPPEDEARRELIGRVSLFLTPLVLMPVLGAWFLVSMPADCRLGMLGESPTLTMLAAVGVGASLVAGAYAMGASWYWTFSLNGFAAALMCAIAFVATAGGEFVREGVGKPYSIRQILYSNALRQNELERLRAPGSVAADQATWQRDGVANGVR